VRIGRIPSELFCKRCFVGHVVNSVDPTVQDCLASALELRLKTLRTLCHEVRDRSLKLCGN
jgi:hypothetical protein